MKNSFIAFIALVLVISSCRKISEDNNSVVVNQNDAPNVEQIKLVENLKVEQVIEVLQAAKLPIVELKIFTAETDPNKLLGRPNQYTGKASWKYSKDAPSHSQNTIEVFNNSSDLEARKNYVETVTTSASPLVQYIFAHKNILLRLNHDLTPDAAAKYEAALKSL